YARRGDAPLARRPGRRHQEDDVLPLERRPRAVQELLAVESNGLRVSGLVHFQRRLPRRARVRPAAHEPVAAPVAVARGQLLPRLLPQQKREQVGDRVDGGADFGFAAGRGGELRENRQRGGIARRVSARYLLVDGAQCPVRVRWRLRPLAGNQNTRAAARLYPGERLPREPTSPAVAQPNGAARRGGVRPVARELEGVEGARLEPEPADTREQ